MSRRRRNRRVYGAFVGSGHMTLEPGASAVGKQRDEQKDIVSDS